MATKTKIRITDAKQLAQCVLENTGYSNADAEVITHHLIDSELRGYPSTGLARIISIRDRLEKPGKVNSALKITRESPTSAQIDGKDTLGYLVARFATKLAIDKAKRVSIAVVGAIPSTQACCLISPKWRLRGVLYHL
ncbi:hypothetical protein OIDMADRAFT_61204 [Oidiodendron maius Zn]|uniref:Uncharacterized protein n=1 Tax=Oidiodendron maius (strain Zn) TaxID=913774 RepID=A0A0C3GU68_OIDMZ|nr:hypothetical protein OIDMADRAFT_61204 [Oidiodendron maius Zn]